MCSTQAWGTQSHPPPPVKPLRWWVSHLPFAPLSSSFLLGLLGHRASSSDSCALEWSLPASKGSRRSP